MELLHYGAEPVGKLELRNQEKCRVFKPNGFWVSVGDSWKEWCESECFGLKRLECVSKIILKPTANILTLTSPEQLDEFSREYGEEKISIYFEIDWAKVANEYDGIIITPYIYERRLELMWYYGWDCASGCIWNTDCIQSITLQENENGMASQGIVGQP